VVEIRTERPEDSAAISQVHTRAFGGAVEAKLVQLICEREKGVIALVAASEGTVVGHILFSRVTIDNSAQSFNGIGLAPIAVLPEYQRMGIGSKLIGERLQQCKQSGYDAVVVLGDPNYYSRFGFLRAADFGLQNEYGVHDEFMVLPLHGGALEGIGGMVKYLPKFREAEA